MIELLRSSCRIDARDDARAVREKVVESLPATRILLLVNYRPEYRHQWSSRSYYTQLQLDALPPESVDELLDALLGEEPSLQPLKALLVERTAGNPFFVEESVRALVETGALAGEPGAYRLTRDLPAIRMPGTVQSVLAARIDRLPADDKRLLQVAAVIGKDVPHALLEAVASQEGLDLRRGLAHLQEAELVYEAQLFPEPEYTFKHALTHEVAYGSLLQERRRALHVRIMRALEQLHAENPGEQVERLALIQPDTGRRLLDPGRLASPPPADEHALYQEMLYARIPAGRQRQLHLRLGDRLEAAFGGRSAELTAQLALHFDRGGDRPRAARCRREAGRNALRRHAHREAIAHTPAGPSPSSRPCPRPGDHRGAIVRHARAKSDEANRPRQGPGRAARPGVCPGLAAYVRKCRPEIDGVLEVAAAELGHCREQQYPYCLAWGLMHRSWALAEQGHYADGLIEIKDGLAAYQETGAEVGLAHFQTLYVEARARAGETLEALVVVDEPSTSWSANDNRWHERKSTG